MIFKLAAILAMVLLSQCYTKDYGRMTLMDMLNDAILDAFETCEIQIKNKYQYNLYGADLFQTSSKFKNSVIEFHFHYYHPLFQYEYDATCDMDVILWTVHVSLTWSTSLRDLREFKPLGL